MICDDSALIRAAIGRMLDADPAVRVVARVANGQQALDEMARQPIDVVILDIEMPVMDGLTALPLLLKADPAVRVVIASTLTTRGADIALRALRAGAADYLPKPSAASVAGDGAFRNELLAKVKGLARLRRRGAQPDAAAAPAYASGSIPLRPKSALAPRLLAIGSSTGGPQALFTLIKGLGAKLPVPVVITQHMPPTFTAMLAEHITKLGVAPCAEARDGDVLEPGRLYLAPGDRHLLVEAVGTRLVARLSTDPPENFCRPAVDPMLRSAATACGGRVLVVMLTGMGHDGLAGTRAVTAAGGAALAQDETSSVVWGMPGAIAQAGLCEAVVPLPQLAARIHESLRMRSA
jgi:two-component system chemotaxis response regulator CheB